MKDNTGAWIPFGLLTFEGVQPLLSFGHRNEVVRTEAQNFLKACGPDYLKSTATELFQECGTNIIQKKWLSVSDESVSFASTPHLMSCVRQPTVEGDIKGKIGIVQVGFKEESMWVQCLESALKRRYSKVERKRLISSTIINQTAMIELKEAKVLIVVLSEDDWTTTPLKQIVARLHRTADTDLGVPLICTTLSRLGRKICEAIRPTAYIPTDLYAKIDCLLGSTKIDHPELRSSLDGGNLMIVGAHVAHIGNGKVYCPSIAAMVASKNAAGLQYSGSVRIQPGTVADARKPKLEIEQFDKMMLELFKQWENQKAPPSRMLFFRDSIDFDNAISRVECEKIQQAYTTAFPTVHSTLEIAYVVVNKNTALTYKHTDASTESKVIPIDDYLATGDANAKYRYYIVDMDMNMSKTKLADIVGSA